MTFKQAEKQLREHGLALAYGPHGSSTSEPRWFAATETGDVVAEGRTWLIVVDLVLKGKTK